MIDLTLPSGKPWKLRFLRNSLALEVVHVRDRLARQAVAAGDRARALLESAKGLEGEAQLDADEQAGAEFVRAAQLSDAAAGWVIQALWTGTPLGATQGPEATGAAMLDLLDREGWDPGDVAYLAAASLVVLCSPWPKVRENLARLDAAPAAEVAASASEQAAAEEAAVAAEVNEAVPFSGPGGA